MNETKTKGMCVATRCTSVEQFVQMFHRFVDDDAFFIATKDMRPAGLETAFSIQLADKTPVLRGVCVVLQAWPTSANPFRHPGLRLGVRRLTASSMAVFEKLLVTRSAGEPVKDWAEMAATTVAPKRLDSEPTVPDVRTPGSDLVLPANPLQNLTDESLEGYVDCTLYEETSNFFPAPENPDDIVDELIEPPTFAPRRVVKRAATPSILVDEEQLTPPPTEMPLPRPAAIMVPAKLEPPKIVVPPIEPPKPVAPAAAPAKPVVPVAVPKLVAPVAEPAKPIAPAAEPAKFVVPAAEYAKPVAPAAEPPNFVAPTAEPPKLVAPAAESAKFVAPPAAPPTIRRADFEPPEPAPPAPEPNRNDSTPLLVASGPVPQRRSRSRLWLVAGAAAIVAAAIAVPLVARSSSGSSDEAPPPSEPTPAAARAPEVPAPPPVAARAEPPAVVHRATPAADDESSGPGVVGDGPCRIAVVTTPAGSTIQLDGKTLGPSPITLAATCEKHRVDIAHPRYETTTRWVTPGQDKPESIDVNLPRPTHRILVTSSPLGAEIYLDGHGAGWTPTYVEVAGFTTLKFTFEKRGFHTQQVRHYSKVAEDHLSVQLTK